VFWQLLGLGAGSDLDVNQELAQDRCVFALLLDELAMAAHVI
jgi:hypothetical protein